MKFTCRKAAFAITLMISTIMACAKEVNRDTQTQSTITESSIVLYDDVIIDRSIEILWPELLDFVSWYFTGQHIERIKGQPGQVGETLVVNNALRHEIISIRALKNIVWKTCLITSCEKDVVFSNFLVEGVDGKSRLIRNVYSQGFWSEKFVAQYREDTSNGKIPNSVRKVSLAFKEYVENKK